MTKVARTIYGALLKSNDIPNDTQAALRQLVDDGKLSGFLLAIYGEDSKANWRARPSDMLNTIITVVEFATGNKDVAKKVGDLIAVNIQVPNTEVN